MAFINANKDDVVAGRRLGVERICRVQQVAPSTYYAANDRLASTRQLRDTEIAPLLLEIGEDNYLVYGVRKFRKAAKRAGIDIGRDQTARLMKILDIEVVRRSKRVKTTKPAPDAVRHSDLVNQVFGAEAPNRFWDTDLTGVIPLTGVGCKACMTLLESMFDRVVVMDDSGFGRCHHPSRSGHSHETHASPMNGTLLTALLS